MSQDNNYKEENGQGLSQQEDCTHQDDSIKNPSPNKELCHDKPTIPRTMVNPANKKKTQQARLRKT